MPKPELEFFSPEVADLKWEPLPGFSGKACRKILTRDPGTENKTVMVNIAPGVKTTQVSMHDYWEEVFIIDGFIRDLTTNQVFTKGMYGCRQPGMKHGPYEILYGALVFEFHYTGYRLPGHPDEKNTVKSEVELFNPLVSDLKWTPMKDFSAGLYEMILTKDQVRGDKARLVKCLPGVITDRSVIHDFWEEIYIIDGVVIDLGLNQTFTAGMYCCRPPGMKHAPYSFPFGATLFEIHYY